MTSVPFRRGVTLIELLVAITLAAGLLVAMLGVLRAVKQPIRRAQQVDLASNAWQQGLRKWLLKDLQQASSIHQSGGTIWMHGNFESACDPISGTDVVGYTCMPMGSSSALTRIEANGIELFALGMQRIVVERVDESGTPQPLPPMAGPVPDRLRVWIRGNQSDVLFAFDVVAH